MIKTGTRLQSQVCDTQVIVVRSSGSLDDLRAGGVPMIPPWTARKKPKALNWIRTSPVAP